MVSHAFGITITGDEGDIVVTGLTAASTPNNFIASAWGMKS